MSERNLLFEREDSIATITMNRPEKRNPLSFETITEMISLLRDIGSSREVRAVILAGKGPAFCAGHDLAELRGRDVAFYRREFDLCSQLMATIESIPQPVIASVHGIATAAGCQLVATCDLAVAGESARFATPGVRIGLFCSTPMVALTCSIGRKHAMEMLLTGRAIDSRTAAEWGLVNRVVADAQLGVETRQLAMQIAQSSPLTLAIGKQAFYAQIELDEKRAYSYTKEVMSLNAMAADAQEGICAFLEKRNPVWRGT